ncbi:MAG: PQQ-binding-like beta-propeller repeat protein [Sedimentisphaerales bacterium]|jgi:outer membrane protein assembly factor BamB|nr:PQQ-binding-like beta-propeller repeat protein [Sedimentisphaerales bacterium]
MRAKLKTALIITISVVLFAVIAAIIIKPHVKRRAPAGSALTSGAKYLAASADLAPPFRRGFDSNDELILPNGNWPMFRGEQRLLGRTSGSLPDKLRLVWKFKTKGSVKSSPAIVDGQVFIGSSDANLYAIDLKDGHKIWTYTTDGAVEATPCVIRDSVFVGSSDNFLYAINAKTGTLQWKYKTDGKILGGVNWTLSPDNQNPWILVGSYDTKLYCVDSSTGKAVWIYETQNYINGAPAVDDEKAVFGGCDAMIHVISLHRGQQISQIDTGSFIAASPAILQGRVYVGNYAGVFICADISKGDIIWKYTTGDSPIFSSPAVDENVVIFGGRDKRIHCLRREDGKLLWELVTLGEVDSSPVICGDKVVVGSEDGRLYMLELSKGILVWSYEIGQAITSSPAVANGMVVVGCDDGFVYAFGDTD